jgi:hypothetical protein
MKDYLISMFIDNELNLDEKIDFVETVHENRLFKDEAVDLLAQEKLLHGDMIETIPEVCLPVETKTTPGFFKMLFPPLAGFATAVTVMAAIFLLRPEPVISGEELHRFVIYQPGSSQAEIVGSFTDWAPLAMDKVGSSGYWALTLKIPAGEHRYSYLVENGRQIPDPTVLAREQDDFGGENSIIKVNVAI